MSRPVSWPAESCGWILPKNSLLSLMSSVYLTLMPLRRVNASSVGCRRPLSSMSMYSVQLEKETSFSSFDRSSDDTPPSVLPAGGMPQALSVPSPPTASAPPAEARSSERRVRAALPWVKLRRMAATWAGDRRSGSYCSMRVVALSGVSAVVGGLSVVTIGPRRRCGASPWPPPRCCRT